MSDYDYDLFVIGGGSGGVRAARIAAGHGARVGIADEYRYGGTCVIRGCVPKKLLVYAAHVRREIDDAAGFGWSIGDVRFDWAALIAAKDREISRLEGIYQRLLEQSSVTVYKARAVFTGPHTLRVGDREVSAEHILIATGGHPSMPDTPGIEHAISSNEAFELERLEPHMTVVGGGYVALEFACIFQRLGAQVTLVYRGPALLRGFDEDVREAVTDNVRTLGIDLRCQTDIEAIERVPDGIDLALTGGGRLRTGSVMYATGRTANTGGLGLEHAGVETDHRGAVCVNEYSRTTASHIYAVGDVTARLQLTPVAIREGHAVADTLFADRPTPVDHAYVPTAVFCQPPVACVGLTEAAARARGEVDVYAAAFRPLKHSISGAADKVLIKMIVDRASDRVLGVHMVGDDAAEIIQAMAIAVKAGVTKAQVDATTALHPTAAEELVLMRTPRA